MPKQSAGILLYRKVADSYEVLLVHPGGPFWAKKDEHAWSVPKGEFTGKEAPLAAAKREFTEEVGTPPEGDYMALAPASQPSGKIVYVFALEADFDLANFKSNTVDLECPPKSGRTQAFPENDRAEWIPLADAAYKLVKGQGQIIQELTARLEAAAQASLF